MKRFISLVMCLMFCVSVAVPASASTTVASAQQVYNQMHNMTYAEFNAQLETMSLDEINDLIDLIFENRNSSVSLYSDGTQDLKYAWLAAAGALQVGGYTCTAKLIQYSVEGNDYWEENGTFAAKIKTTSEYAEWKSNPCNSSLVFTTTDNADLYYSLHNVNIYYYPYETSKNIRIFDTWNFDNGAALEGLLNRFVNNVGALMQNAGVLEEVVVNIYFQLN